MKLSQVKHLLQNIEELRFQLPDSTFVPKHFHVTEIGVISKQFIDCGGMVRNEKIINFQLWQADDYEHRLAPQKPRIKLSSLTKTAQCTPGSNCC